MTSLNMSGVFKALILLQLVDLGPTFSFGNLLVPVRIF